MSELIIFFAGCIAGAMNSLAGGGSTVSYAALTAIGIPPIMANATNTVATIAGYVAGLAGFRPSWQGLGLQIIWQIALAVIGGILGAWLLTQTPEAMFRQFVPWLLLGASVLFLLSPPSTDQGSKQKALFISTPILILVFIYGGYFQAGLGILTLAALSVLGFGQIIRMSGIKLIFAIANAIAASILFAQHNLIDWNSCLILMAGLVTGGFGAARIATHLPATVLRKVIAAIALSVTAYFFYATYFSNLS